MERQRRPLQLPLGKRLELLVRLALFVVVLDILHTGILGHGDEIVTRIPRVVDCFVRAGF